MKSFWCTRRIFLGVLLLGVVALRFIPHGGEFYATWIYPGLSFALSWISAFCPYSLEEILVCLFLGLLVFLPLTALFLHRKPLQILCGEIEILLWVLAWFYWGWGNTYFRSPFHERMMIVEATYTPEAFQQFLTTYTDSLNASYLPGTRLSRSTIRTEIKKGYAKLPPGFGLTRPQSFQHPKKLLFNELYSQVGVSGFMGPFAAESQVNQELSTLEYPFVYAHELSHLLGISNEAEANFWAFFICSRSADKFIRYSGYNGLLSYVSQNARQTLSRSDYESWLGEIRPEVLEDERNISRFWKQKRNPVLNQAQNWLYNLYLKGNNIPQGMENYNQVIGMLIAFQESQEEELCFQGRTFSSTNRKTELLK